MGAAARGCALAPDGEAAEGGTGGIRSLHGNSCTDSGGWAGAPGGGRRGGSSQGGGEGRGEGARGRRERAHLRAHTLSPAHHPHSARLSAPPSLGSSLACPRRLPGAPQRPPSSCCACLPNLGRVHALPSPGSAPARRRPRPLPRGPTRAGLGRVGTAAAATRQRDNGGFVPTAGEGQFHV